MMLELAIGDAFGGCFEYASREFIDKFNDLSGYPDRRSEYDERKPGRYTDDTQMTIAIVEAMFSGEPWTRELLAQKFIEAYKRDPRPGYARRFGKFLEEVSDATEFLEKMDPRSDKSGGAMRATPLGMIKDLNRALKACALQASITHNTIDGINAALASTAMTHYFAYGLGPKADLGRYLETVVDGQWSVPYLVSVGAKGWMSVRAAITAVQESDSMSGLLKRCVNFGGDVDTVATIAMAAASMSDEIAKDIPQVLVDQLENEQFGKDYLGLLDHKLMSLREKGQDDISSI